MANPAVENFAAFNPLAGLNSFLWHHFFQIIGLFALAILVGVALAMIEIGIKTIARILVPVFAAAFLIKTALGISWLALLYGTLGIIGAAAFIIWAVFIRQPKLSPIPVNNNDETKNRLG